MNACGPKKEVKDRMHACLDPLAKSYVLFLIGVICGHLLVTTIANTRRARHDQPAAPVFTRGDQLVLLTLLFPWYIGMTIEHYFFPCRVPLDAVPMVLLANALLLTSYLGGAAAIWASGHRGLLLTSSLWGGGMSLLGMILGGRVWLTPRDNWLLLASVMAAGISSALIWHGWHRGAVPTHPPADAGG